MRQQDKFLAVTVLLVIAVCFAALPAAADFTGELELGKTDCSVTLTLGDGSGAPETDLVGGKIALYRVAGIRETEDKYVYDPAEGQFAGSENVRDIPAMNSAELEAANAEIAARLAAESLANHTAPLAEMPISGGNVRFENLRVGLYLFTQTEASAGEKKITPFLLSVPSGNQGLVDSESLRRSYAVVAAPKAGYSAPPPSPPVTAPPVTPSPTPSPTPTPPPRTPLPQTGQLWWPVPVMALLGIALLALGIGMRRWGGREANE